MCLIKSFKRRYASSMCVNAYKQTSKRYNDHANHPYCTSPPGLVFDVGSSADDLPSYISYKIRIDSEHVDTTSAKKVTDR